MTSSYQFNAFAASRGEGLHPKLRDLLERAAASPLSETSIRHDGMLQAGPNPASELVELNGTVVSFPPEKRPERGRSDYGSSHVAAYRLA